MEQEKNVEFKLIPFGAIEIPSDNPRAVNTEADDFKALVNSVKQFGIQVPLLVIPNVNFEKDPTYVLRAGFRRYMACLGLKVESIPCMIVRGVEPFVITWLENYARRPLTIIEEARAAAKLMDVMFNDVAAVAAVMGIAKYRVAQRLQVLKLTGEWKNEIEMNSWLVRAVTPKIIDSVTVFKAEIQDQILAAVKSERLTLGEITSETLEEIVNRFAKLVSSAPWDKKVEVGGHVPCAGCPDRTDANPSLFPDSVKAACLNRPCWDDKTASHVEKVFSETLKDENSKAGAFISEKVKPVIEIAKKFGRVFKLAALEDLAGGEDRVSEKKAHGMAPVVILDGPHPGDVVWVPEAIIKHIPEEKDSGTIRAEAANIVKALYALEKPFDKQPAMIMVGAAVGFPKWGKMGRADISDAVEKSVRKGLVEVLGGRLSADRPAGEVAREIENIRASGILPTIEKKAVEPDQKKLPPPVKHLPSKMRDLEKKEPKEKAKKTVKKA